MSPGAILSGVVVGAQVLRPERRLDALWLCRLAELARQRRLGGDLVQVESASARSVASWAQGSRLISAPVCLTDVLVVAGSQPGAGAFSIWCLN